MAEHPILIDKEQDRENSPPLPPITPVSERPTQPTVLMRSRPFGTRNDNLPDYFFKNFVRLIYIFVTVVVF